MIPLFAVSNAALFILIPIALVVVLLLMSGKRRQQLGDAVGAQADKLAGWIWTRDPKALMEREISRIQTEIEGFTPVMGTTNATIASLGRQITSGQEKVDTLQARYDRKLDEGDVDGATSTKIDLDKAKADLEENRKQLNNTEKNYNTDQQRITVLNGQLAELRKEAVKMGMQDKLADLDRLGAQVGTVMTNANSGMGKINEIRTKWQEQIDQKKGEAKAIRDLGGVTAFETEAAEKKKDEEHAARKAVEEEMARRRVAKS